MSIIKEKVELQTFHFLVDAIAFAKTVEKLNEIQSKEGFKKSNMGSIHRWKNQL